MSKNSISASYNGAKMTIESGKDKLIISKRQAYALKMLLEDFDAMYNLSGRDLTESEWDELSKLHKECVNMKVCHPRYFNFGDKDKDFAFLKLFEENDNIKAYKKDDVIVVIKNPF